MLVFLAACSSPPTPAAPSSDPAATEGAIDALCKLFEGADRTCHRAAAGVLVDGRTFGVEAATRVESSTGMTTVRGTIELTSAASRHVTRLRGFGSGRSDALERALHEWALVSGIAVVDGWMSPTVPRALQAVQPDAEALAWSKGPVTRGWTYFQPRGVLEHARLLEAVTPSLAADERGALTFEVTRQSGSTQVECFLQGRPHAAVCEAARAWTWPDGTYELRTTYVLGE